MKKLAVLAALMAVGIASPAWAEKFGMVEIVAGQTARLNVVNTIGDPNTRRNCRVALSILDSQGNILVDDPDQIPGPGQATFLDLDAATFERRLAHQNCHPEPFGSAQDKLREGSRDEILRCAQNDAP